MARRKNCHDGVIGDLNTLCQNTSIAGVQVLVAVAF